MVTGNMDMNIVLCRMYMQNGFKYMQCTSAGEAVGILDKYVNR
jgi:hypothetical protein